MSQPQRVLVVEDQDDSRGILSRMLRKRGCDVKAFAHANDNLDAMAAFDRDVALVDVRMPGRSGDELAPDLIRRCPGTRVIFLTGEAKLDNLKAAVPSCLVLRKPVDFAVLGRLLDCL
jgi:DNA-binding NtrC family response regulator